ncbi:hypothetical protein ACFFRR_001097 [Megaselia abdita]
MGCLMLMKLLPRIIKTLHPSHHHLITSTLSNIVQYQQLDGSAYSKRDVLYVIYDLHLEKHLESFQQTYRDFQNINHEKLFEDISNTNWRDSNSKNSQFFSSVDECYHHSAHQEKESGLQEI